MRLQEYQLDNTLSKTNENLILHRSEKAAVELDKGAIAIAVKVGDRNRGYIFLGEGKMLVDAIVETQKGAIGKPIIQKLDNPFLMLGNAEAASKHTTAADSEDLENLHLSVQEFKEKAQNLLDKFLKGKHTSGIEGSSEHEGTIFAFLGNEGSLESLLLKNSRITYKSNNLSFVSMADKSVLESSGKVVLSIAGRSVFVGRSPTFHRCH